MSFRSSASRRSPSSLRDYQWLESDEEIRRFPSAARNESAFVFVEHEIGERAGRIEVDLSTVDGTTGSFMIDVGLLHQ